MCSHVGFQVVFMLETSVTYITLVGLISAVSQKMTVQIGFGFELSLAVFTGELLHRASSSSCFTLLSIISLLTGTVVLQQRTHVWVQPPASPAPLGLYLVCQLLVSQQDGF